jgi:rhodanese-related sulfurtransferase
MIDNAQDPPPPCIWRCAGRIVAEAALVAVAGVALALLANQLSPHHLKLTFNYYRGDLTKPSPPADGITLSNGVSVPNSTNAGESLLEAKLRTEGMHLLTLAQAEQLLHDPRLQQNLILFVDARGEDDYAKGHIPGAAEFYPYHPEKYLAEILPGCQIAQQIVVYCTGGECEDSHSAALFLRDNAQVPADKLYVFGGGMTEWEAAKQPLEIGPRNSGNIRNPAP